MAERQRGKRGPSTARTTAPESMDKSNSIGLTSHFSRAPEQPTNSGLLMAAITSPTQKSLSQHKKEYNAIYERFNMPVPYPSPEDDSQPLLPEHTAPSQGDGDMQGDGLF